LPIPEIGILEQAIIDGQKKQAEIAREINGLEKDRIKLIEDRQKKNKQAAREAPIIAQLKKLNKELDAANQKLADAKERVAKAQGATGFSKI